MRRIIVASVVLLTLAGCQTILKKEHATGELDPQTTVLVDDGTCPDGQVKQVTGGDRSKGQQRQRTCVPRPTS